MQCTFFLIYTSALLYFLHTLYVGKNKQNCYCAVSKQKISLPIRIPHGRFWQTVSSIDDHSHINIAVCSKASERKQVLWWISKHNNTIRSDRLKRSAEAPNLSVQVFNTYWLGSHWVVPTWPSERSSTSSKTPTITIPRYILIFLRLSSLTHNKQEFHNMNVSHENGAQSTVFFLYERSITETTLAQDKMIKKDSNSIMVMHA